VRKVLVTGGAGFIGSWVVRHLLTLDDVFVLNVDKLTYAADHESALAHIRRVNYHFELADICDVEAMRALVQQFAPDVIMHLAAESHVDRSIDDAARFIQTNVFGTYILLQESRRYWASLAPAGRASFRFHHISTDEVFGSLGSEGYFAETTPYQPN
jgi:dTDP-glucose 4,6-dehydratase